MGVWQRSPPVCVCVCPIPLPVLVISHVPASPCVFPLLLTRSPFPFLPQDLRAATPSATPSNLGQKVTMKQGPAALQKALSTEERAAAREAMLARKPTGVTVPTLPALPTLSLPTKATAPAKPTAPAAVPAPAHSVSPLQRRAKVAALSLSAEASPPPAAVSFPVTQGLRFEPEVVDFGAVSPGIYRLEVVVENVSQVPLPATVPSHYLYHNGEAGEEGEGVNTVCACLPDDEQLPLLQP